ncbi:MAG: type I-C CRISPR-associated protein Cas7/Csd2, partial [Gammaproteobacteria bacterium]|nr:type I-C CRISPR-associated protein Cas7/Csd2 [Gammaproteobacteria bacterium]
MTTQINSGQVRGPVQLAFAKSEDPIIPLEISITRMAVTTEKEAEDQQGDNRTMGRKHIVPYGLYRAHGFISAKLAEKTGFSDQDLEKLWQSLQMMFEHDHSAARGEMNARKLIVFKHKDALGNMPSHKLFERVTIERVKGEQGTPAGGFDDYAVKVNTDGLEEKGVAVMDIL